MIQIKGEPEQAIPTHDRSHHAESTSNFQKLFNVTDTGFRGDVAKLELRRGGEREYEYNAENGQGQWKICLHRTQKENEASENPGIALGGGMTT